ncbi:Uncharacterised protein [Mycobacterium tuberculosis]|nr:Uncharacterised protein [Mycobacterium tuberculosis]
MSFIRFRVRKKVVLPEPVGPINDVTARAGKPILTWSSTVLPAKPRVRFTAAIAGAAASTSAAPLWPPSRSHAIGAGYYMLLGMLLGQSAPSTLSISGPS